MTQPSLALTYDDGWSYHTHPETGRRYRIRIGEGYDHASPRPDRCPGPWKVDAEYLASDGEWRELRNGNRRMWLWEKAGLG